MSKTEWLELIDYIEEAKAEGVHSQILFPDQLYPTFLHKLKSEGYKTYEIGKGHYLVTWK